MLFPKSDAKVQNPTSVPSRFPTLSLAVADPTAKNVTSQHQSGDFSQNQGKLLNLNHLLLKSAEE
jgi:hypothetical protein